jgi:hypothetical protein
MIRTLGLSSLPLAALPVQTKLLDRTTSASRGVKYGNRRWSPRR